MIFKIGILVYLAFVGVRNFKQQNLLLGGYVVARDYDGVDLKDALLIDAYVNKLTKEILVNRFYSIAGFILVFFALFQ